MPGYLLGQRLLVPLDGSDLATASLPYVRRLCTPESEIELLRVVPDPTPMTELAGTSKFPNARIAAEKTATAQTYLETVKSSLGDIPGQVRLSVTVGDPADEILRIADEHQCGLVIMASHVRGALGRMVIGSTTDQVARESPVPVMVICHPGDQEDHKPAPVRRIIVPLDGSALSMHALPVAAEMARQYQLPVVLVRAIHAVDEKLPVAFDANAAARHAMAVDSSSLWWEAKTFLGAEAKTLRTRGIAATSKVVSGPAAAGISGIIEEGDMIIMTSHGESGVRRWILGSVAQMLLRAGVAPVVLVPSRQHSGVGTHEEPGVVKTLPDPAHLDI